MHVHGGVRGARRVGQGRPPATVAKRVQRLVILAARRRPGSPPAHPVKRRIYHDPVQPGRDGGIATEAGGPAESGNHRVLERVGGLLGVAQRADRHRPEPVSVALEELAERVRVAIDMPLQQLGIGWSVVVTQPG